jgi:hypothetical protein
MERLVTEQDEESVVPPGNCPSSESGRHSSESDRHSSETVTASSEESPDALDHTSGGGGPGRPPPGALWLATSLAPTEAELVELNALSDERSDYWCEMHGNCRFI